MYGSFTQNTRTPPTPTPIHHQPPLPYHTSTSPPTTTLTIPAPNHHSSTPPLSLQQHPPPQQQYNSRHSLLGSSRHDSSEQLTVRHHNGRGNGEYSVFIISAPCTHSEVLSLILVTSTRVARLGKFFNEVTSASLFLRRPTPGPRPYLH